MLWFVIFVAFGICSTCLVRINFWKNASYGEFHSNIIYEITSFILGGGLSAFLFIIGFPLISFILVIFFQIIRSHLYYGQKMLFQIIGFLAMILVCGFFTIKTGMSYYNFTTPLDGKWEVTLTDEIPSANDISEIYNVIAEGPTSNNQYWIYSYNDPKSNHQSLIVIDQIRGETLFIPTEFRSSLQLDLNFGYSQRRLYTAVSDDLTPYGVYAISKRNLLGVYSLSNYVLVNLQTGDFQNYTSIEDLPTFVTNF